MEAPRRTVLAFLSALALDTYETVGRSSAQVGRASPRRGCSTTFRSCDAARHRARPNREVERHLRAVVRRGLHLREVRTGLRQVGSLPGGRQGDGRGDALRELVHRSRSVPSSRFGRSTSSTRRSTVTGRRDPRSGLEVASPFRASSRSTSPVLLAPSSQKTPGNCTHRQRHPRRPHHTDERAQWLRRHPPRRRNACPAPSGSPSATRASRQSATCAVRSLA
jgi:hypothetical protein